LRKHPVLVKGRIEIPKPVIHGGGCCALKPKQKRTRAVGLESGVVIIILGAKIGPARRLCRFLSMKKRALTPPGLGRSMNRKLKGI
jgi:hypothetical protein